MAALKEQAAKEGGLDATLAPIIEGATSDVAAPPASTAGESGAHMWSCHVPAHVMLLLSTGSGKISLPGGGLIG